MDALPKLMKRKLFKKSCGQILPNNKQQSDRYIMVALEKYKPEQYCGSIYNFIIWLASPAGKMNQIVRCDWLPEWGPLGTARCIPQAKFHQKPYNKSFTDQVCSVKMAGYWPRSFFVCLWTSTLSWSINMQKKNLANNQPSWPHTWSITHTYIVQLPLKNHCTFLHRASIWFFDQSKAWPVTNATKFFSLAAYFPHFSLKHFTLLETKSETLGASWSKESSPAKV